jgi:hypothetical protein
VARNRASAPFASCTYSPGVADQADDVAQPEWAFAWHERDDGTVIYTDQGGERLVALAVTRDELRLLESGLQQLAQSEGRSLLLDRLAMLHADLGE